VSVVATIAIACTAALLAAGLHHLVQRRFGYDILARHNDVAGFLYSAIGVIFAVALGFVVVVVWQRYDQVRSDVDAEVAAVIDLDHDAQSFPPNFRRLVERQLTGYASVVVTREWPEMARGELAVAGSPELERVAYEVQTFHPAGPMETDAHQLALLELKDIFDARRQRIRATEPSMPPLLWFALDAGAIATLGFTYLFGVRNHIAQLLMTGVLAALIAVMFVVIHALDSPFRGPSAIQPSGWQYFIDRAPAISSE